MRKGSGEGFDWSMMEKRNWVQIFRYLTGDTHGEFRDLITKSIRYYLCSSAYNEVAIIEALRLSSVDTTEIKKHVDKAVTNGDDPTYYDRLYGLAMNYKRMLDELRADKKSSPSTSQFYH